MTTLQIKRVSKDWLVTNGDKHAHFKSRRGCITLVNLINSGKMPTNKYFRVAALRVLDDDQVAELNDRLKPRYFNKPMK